MCKINIFHLCLLCEDLYDGLCLGLHPAEKTTVIFIINTNFFPLSENPYAVLVAQTPTTKAHLTRQCYSGNFWVPQLTSTL